jgi:hypothetical protein
VFQYWHKGNGSMIFSMISVLLFSACCWALNHQTNATEQDLEQEDDANPLELQER